MPHVVALVGLLLSAAGTTAPRQASAAASATPGPVDHATLTLYRTHCAACHGEGRLGVTGPALIPEQFERAKPAQLVTSILDGRPATQMAAFKDRLSRQQAEALVRLILTPLPVAPSFTIDDVKKSRAVPPDAAAAPAPKPVFAADPLNLFFVVELGDHHVTVLDGDKLEPLVRQKTRAALHGGIKYSPDGRFAWWVTRDGWITRYDVWGLKPLLEVRVGINTRNIAVSSDGKVIMAANALPRTLVALDAATLEPLKVIDVAGKDGTPSRVSAVYAAPPRSSFVAALKDVPEIWELPWGEDERAPVEGLVHDYRRDSGELGDAPRERFPVRRIGVDAVLDDFFFDAKYDNLLGASRSSDGGHVVNLVVGRTVAKVPLAGMPHLGAGIAWDRNGARVMATPNLKEGVISVLDTATWTEVGRIKTLGPGFFLRSHERSRYAFADVFFGPDKDKVHVIDKATLEIVATLQPAPGKTAAHTEFTKDGSKVLLSIWEDDGALVVYDAATLKELKRLPMKKPSGKYNVFNKIKFSEGTSH
ncbi:MAG: c-type cytochrome [Deltaproteobacteria bacterium]|nr:c-type cytochrome [Deltaproteobacteria bacterium]